MSYAPRGTYGPRRHGGLNGGTEQTPHFRGRLPRASGPHAPAGMTGPARLDDGVYRGGFKTHAIPASAIARNLQHGPAPTPRNVVAQKGVSPINRTMPAAVLNSISPDRAGGSRGAGTGSHAGYFTYRGSVRPGAGGSVGYRQGYGYYAKPGAAPVAPAGGASASYPQGYDVGGRTVTDGQPQLQVSGGSVSPTASAYPAGYDVGGQTVTPQGVNPGGTMSRVPMSQLPFGPDHSQPPMLAAGGFQHPLAAALPLIRNLIANALASQRPASWPSNQ